MLSPGLADVHVAEAGFGKAADSGQVNPRGRARRGRCLPGISPVSGPRAGSLPNRVVPPLALAAGPTQECPVRLPWPGQPLLGPETRPAFSSRMTGW